MLEVIKEKCIQCFYDKYGDEKIIVFGEGNEKAKIMLIGEAPGKQETLQKRPFVGQAGKNLDEFLQALQLNREDIYISNVVKYRPYKINEKKNTTSNRPPKKDEIKECMPFLLEEIDYISPEIIVTLGNVALKSVLDDNKATIGEFHGQLLNLDNRVSMLFPLYHPASIIYNRSLKAVYDDDIQKLRQIVSRK